MSKIIVHRKKTLSQLAQSADMNDIYRMASIEIAGFWQSSSVNKSGTGLTPKEVRLLLPEVLNVREDYYEFGKMVEEYYTNIRIKVPYEGLTLEVGLKDDSKSLSVDNMPEVIEDYLKWKFLLSHPLVAKSEEDSFGLPNTEVFLLDKNKVKKAEISKNVVEDKAIDMYKSAKDSEVKTNMMLQILGVNYKEFKTQEERIVELRKLAFDRPKDFITTYEDKNMETRFYIKYLLHKKILETRFDKIYLIKDGKNQLLGHTEDDTIVELSKKENSETLIYLKNLADGLSKETPIKK